LTLLVSQSVSVVGDGVNETALPLLVLALTGSGLAMGIVGAITTGADFVMGTFAGAMADRGDRKRMMFGADLGRALFTALIPLTRPRPWTDDGRDPPRVGPSDGLEP
jgi:ENTS family enterobactin (siderophore) exporter